MNISENKVSSLPTTGFMRLQQILEYIPVSKSTFWLRVKQGKFPKGSQKDKNRKPTANDYDTSRIKP